MIIGPGIRFGAGIQLSVVPGNAWDLAYATFNGISHGTFKVSAQESAPAGMFFKPDGTKMYVAGSTGDDINEYDLSTAWSVVSASYVQNVSIAAQEAVLSAIFFKTDGDKMYVIGSTGDDVNEYSLSNAWNVATASYVRTFSIAAQETAPSGLFFSPDGDKMYVTGSTGDDINEYDLSTAWNVATASYVQNFSVATQDTIPTDVHFKPDGTKMYVTGVGSRNLNEYDLSTAWNVASASYVQNFSLLNEDFNPQSVFFKPEGDKMYVLGSTGDEVNEYDLSTAWNIATASYVVPTQNYFDVSAQETAPSGIFFKPDGDKMYVIGTTGDDVNEYSLSIAWDVASASYVQNVSVAAQETAPRDIFFKPDGTKMYVTGTTGDDVNEYDLSSAWNIATASYAQNVSIAAQEANPQGIFFKPEGDKMYVTGTTGDDINEYDLSTAWNIATASYVQNFSVAAQATSPQAVFFKPDGTKMYTVDLSTDSVSEYNLSSAWNVATANYVLTFSVATQAPAPQGLFFKPDGTRMYIVDQGYPGVWAYDI
jgi:DNA-binding beta-propeller fold protein YncE